MAKDDQKAEDGKAAATVTDQSNDQWDAWFKAQDERYNELAGRVEALEKSGEGQDSATNKGFAELEQRVAKIEEQDETALASRVSTLESTVMRDTSGGVDRVGMTAKQREREEEKRQKEAEERKRINDKLGNRGRVKSL